VPEHDHVQLPIKQRMLDHEHGSNSPEKPPQTKAEKHPQPVPEHEHVQPPIKKPMHDHKHGSNRSRNHPKQRRRSTRSRCPSTSTCNRP